MTNHRYIRALRARAEPLPREWVCASDGCRIKMACSTLSAEAQAAVCNACKTSLVVLGKKPAGNRFA
jgi:hypothetical protein